MKLIRNLGEVPTKPIPKYLIDRLFENEEWSWGDLAYELLDYYGAETKELIDTLFEYFPEWRDD